MLLLNNEGDLIQQTIEGDNSAFNILYKTYHARVYAIVAQYVADQDTVDDLVQITFFRAFRALKSFKGKAAFSTWLTRIALNVCRSHFHAQRARRNWINEAEDPECVPGILWNTLPDSNPEKILQ